MVLGTSDNNQVLVPIDFFGALSARTLSARPFLKPRPAALTDRTHSRPGASAGYSPRRTKMMAFLRTNLRWLAAGFILTFASGFGQTWFISLFAGVIKSEYGLTDGTWGSLYTVATLSAGGLMFWRGAAADTVRLSRLALIMTGVFTLASLGMASAGSVWLLGVSLFLLRFCGQGMFSHIAMTAVGRWFEARRGQTVSITNLGHPAGEVVVPILAVFCIAEFGWRPTWLVVAAVLVLFIAPTLWMLLRDDRSPQGHSYLMASTRLGE